jgi:hypothetical protein
MPSGSGDSAIRGPMDHRRWIALLALTLGFLGCLVGCGASRSRKPTDPVNGPLFGCGTGPSFPASALKNPPGAENGSDPAASALRGFFGSATGGGFPSHNWRLLARARDENIYGHGPGELVTDYAVVGQRKGGSWVFRSGGNCTPTRQIPGLVAEHWRLRSAPSAKSRVLELTVRADSCTARNPEAEVRRRFERVQIERGRRSLSLLVLFRSLGNQPCAGVGLPDFPLRVPLKFPVGNPALFDSSTAPPTLIRSRRN